MTLQQRAVQGADSAQIADGVVWAWQEIETALSPIIGQGSVAVLYIRSLHLTSPAHPWLATTHGGVELAMNLASLKSLLARQDSAEAATAGGALLQTFYELLASLVGPSLTERLLDSVWATYSSGMPAQDTSP